MSIEQSRPLRRDAQRNRERILEAAAAVFAVRGFAATLDDVAHHAGVGIGTVYRRFPTKEALLEAIFTDRVEELINLAEQAMAAPVAWEGLVGFLRHSAQLHASDRGLRDVALAVGGETGRFARDRDRIAPLIERLVARAHAEGSLRPDVSHLDIPVILAMISELPLRAAAVRPDLHQRYLQLVIDGLRAGPANGSLVEPPTLPEVDAIIRECVPSVGGKRAAKEAPEA